jgi:predicted metal-dependent peptidase
MASPKRKPSRDPATVAFDAAWTAVREHPLFGPLARRSWVVRRRGDTAVPSGQWAVVTSNGHIHCHPTRRGEPAEWEYVLAHCLLHLGMGHLAPTVAHQDSLAWNAACDHAVSQFLDRLKFGRRPAEYRSDLAGLPRGEQEAYEQLRRQQLPDTLPRDLRFERAMYGRHDDFEATLAVGLRAAVEHALATMSGRVDRSGTPKPFSTVAKAHQWFMNSYPLLGALASGFELIEDIDICRRLDIAVAAVDASERRIYFNPLAGLTEAETRFVMAHEILHVALRHQARVEDRDPYLFNIACDFVINGWLAEMGVGEMPSIGLLYDPKLKGRSAEEIYDLIRRDLRRLRRTAGFRAAGRGDMLGPPDWWVRGEGAALDDFYRSALAQGLSYHESSQAGSLPAGLEEEIRSQIQPPIPWEVELSNWFDQFFAPIETRRSYFRPSRRQAATPDVPRPRTVPTEDALDGRTFGVLLDTSGSMDRVTLARALGSIASYAISRDVPAVRVVFCDAHAYDGGYMQPENILGNVRVLGRGGTVLQPGLDLLHDADDFPDDGPILIITDTDLFDDRLTTSHEHAYLVPQGKRLPFPPKGPVFHMPPSRAEDSW